MSHSPQPAVQLDDHLGYLSWLAGESQAPENSDLGHIEDSLLCKEEINSSAFLNNSGINNVSYTGFSHNAYSMKGNNSAPCGISDLENLELDTPPDFQLAVSSPSSVNVFTYRL